MLAKHLVVVLSFRVICQLSSCQYVSKCQYDTVHAFGTRYKPPWGFSGKNYRLKLAIAVSVILFINNTIDKRGLLARGVSALAS